MSLSRLAWLHYTDLTCADWACIDYAAPYACQVSVDMVCPYDDMDVMLHHQNMPIQSMCTQQINVYKNLVGVVVTTVTMMMCHCGSQHLMLVQSPPSWVCNDVVSVIMSIIIGLPWCV